MVRAIRVVLWVLIVGNWLGVAAAAAMLGALCFGSAGMIDYLTAQALPGNELALRQAMAALCVFGIGIALAVDIILRRVLAIVATVMEDQPFTPANAVRLQHIAWALLWMQILGLGIQALVAVTDHYRVQGLPIAHDDGGMPFPWVPGMTGWLAVLLLFVLARVFAHGTRMQEEIEGTV